MPQWKAEHPWLDAAHSQVLQNVTERVDLAFKAFFRRVKAGEEPGYPRFRGPDRYDSLTYPQYGNGCRMTDGTLKLSRVGAVRLKAHRPLEGTPKTCTIRRASTGKWYATIACEVTAQPLPGSTQETGIDVGLSHFYTLSNGAYTPCPKFLRVDEKDLKRTQPKLSAAPNGAPQRIEQRKTDLSLRLLWPDAGSRPQRGFEYFARGATRAGFGLEAQALCAWESSQGKT